VVEESVRRLVEAGRSCEQVLAALEASLLRALSMLDDSTRADAQVVERARRLPPRAEVDGWSWRGEPAHPWFGEAATVWLTEDRGEAGERGEGGPFLSMAVIAVSDVPDPDARADLAYRLAEARADDLAVQRAFRECWRQLRLGMVMVPEHVDWIDEIPAGESRDGRSWRAAVTLDGQGNGRVSVFFEESAHDPRASTTVSMAVFVVPGPTGG
jgi:hypothetical protein